jgi:hypothetical protein
MQRTLSLLGLHLTAGRVAAAQQDAGPGSDLRGCMVPGVVVLQPTQCCERQQNKCTYKAQLNVSLSVYPESGIVTGQPDGQLPSMHRRVKA